MFGIFQKKPQVEPPLPDLPQAWPPPAIAEIGPRNAQLTPDTKMGILATRVTSGLIIAVGIPIVLSVAGKTERFATQGQVVQAKVDGLRVSRGKSTSYKVSYTFEFEGTPIYDEETVGRSEYDSLAYGSTVPITVMPGNPYSHRYGLVTQQDARDQQMGGSLLVMFLSLSVGVGAAIYRGYAENQKKILRDWLARPAQAIHLKSESAGKSGTTHTLRYRVLMPEGWVEEFVHSETGHGGAPAKPGDMFTAMLKPDPSRQMKPLWTLKTVKVFPEEPRPPLNT